MKKTIQYSLLLLLFVGFASCNNQQINNAKNEKNTLPKELYKLQDDFEYVPKIPYEELTSPDQKIIAWLLLKVALENLKFENDRFDFKLTREEVVAQGLPAPYFEVIANGAIENNIFLEKNADDTLTIASFRKGWVKWEDEKPQLLKQAIDSLNYYQNLVK